MKYIIKKFIGTVIKLLVMALLAKVFFEVFTEPENYYPYCYYLFAELFVYNLMKSIAEASSKESVLPVARYALFAALTSVTGVIVANLAALDAFTILALMFVGYTLNMANSFSVWRFFKSQLNGGRTKYDLYQEEKGFRRRASYGSLEQR